MTADRLEELRRDAIADGAPFNLIALDNVCRLAIQTVRRQEQGGKVIQLKPVVPEGAA
jgi:hypothetical protein